MDVGSKVYRYKFDLANRKCTLEIFEIMETGIFLNGRKRMLAHRISPPGNSDIYVHEKSSEVIGNRKGCKYVLLDHESIKDAVISLRSLLKKNLDFYYGRTRYNADWLDWIEPIYEKRDELEELEKEKSNEA